MESQKDRIVKFDAFTRLIFLRPCFFCHALLKEIQVTIGNNLSWSPRLGCFRRIQRKTIKRSNFFKFHFKISRTTYQKGSNFTSTCELHIPELPNTPMPPNKPRRAKDSSKVASFWINEKQLTAPVILPPPTNRAEGEATKVASEV